MTRSPDLYMIVRAADLRPGGVEYFAADGRPVAEREHAKLYGPMDAQTVARALNLACVPDRWRGEWRAVPAEIRVPSAYQPQGKGADERREPTGGPHAWDDGEIARGLAAETTPHHADRLDAAVNDLCPPVSSLRDVAEVLAAPLAEQGFDVTHYVLIGDEVVVIRPASISSAPR